MNDTLLRGMIAKMDSVERMMSELLTRMTDMAQRQKQILFTMSKGIDPQPHVPKGERDSIPCEICGKRILRHDVMQKTEQRGEALIFFQSCKSCFYRQDK